MGLCSSRKGEPKEGVGGPGSQGQHLDSELLGETYQKLFCRDRRPRGRKAVQRVIQALKPLGLSVRSQILKLGEDWIFLFLLGISMATISFGLDVVISKFQRANLWVYDALEGYRALQYFSWVLYHTGLMMVSAAVAKYISPQAAGSGIPELKVTLRGVVLSEFFTLRTGLAKLVGVICTLGAGSTIFLGKVGPFVHMATILATQLGRVMVRVAGTKENSARKYEMLVAGAAVGVACCFVAPVGGVLFSVEATGTHFALRDYWRGFFSATCAALTFRLLPLLHGESETVAVLFSTSWRVEFPFDLPELLSFALLGVLCGALCCVYLFCHRNLLLLLQNRPLPRRLLGSNKILHAGLVSWCWRASPSPRAGAVPGGAADHEGASGDFLQQLHLGAGGAGGAECLPPAPPPLLRRPLAPVDPPRLSSLEMLSVFLLAKFFMLLLATTMVVPAGYFLPVFVYGAGLGRLYGEIMAKVFPEGIVSDGTHIAIGPAAYALAGAAAYSGAVTHTLSTALLVFELTGQMSHVLPVLIAVLVANGLSQRLQASFFDGIIIAKQLPYLPKLGVGQSGAHDIYAEDFMVRDLKYLPRGCRFKDVRGLLKASSLKQFPLVDSQESRILLGSIRRKHLAKLLSEQLSTEKRFQYLLRQSEENSPTEPLLGADGASGTPEEKPEALKVSAEPGDGETSKEEERGTQLSVKMKDVRHLDALLRLQVEDWECQQLQEPVRLEELPIDPAPYRLLEKETLYQCYDLFNLLGLRTAYVTNVGRLVGVVSLRELKAAVEGSVKGTFVRCREREGDPDSNGASA
ncbi:LOW QUALITY PROTEIN: chloride channel protein ClC-Kb-like [Mauremys reevesii]|uniref:LOW QUALITY PROTEIN: chloride channel protein ClC-Kb-like n=1 Tax=Mauremys reevesii TaxID=260615 RepID=UPI001940201F|nr:LOW QUALITY PROTEIN: chloride channel protein ClC-Kb-like [Mauremys reevesii]